MFKAKFKVRMIEDRGNDNIIVRLHPDLSDKTFTGFTPSGEMWFACNNPEVNKQLEPGKVFELTFTEVE